MRAEGTGYDALVSNAYRSRDEYDVFLGRLTDAEKKVAQAARQTLGASTDTAMADRIENATRRARTAEIDKIFTSDSQ